MRKRIPALLILIIFLVSFAVYFNALSNDFVFDDSVQVLENDWIKDVKYIPDIFSNSVWGFQGETRISNYYRPFMHLIFMFNYYVFGLRPWGFHLVNILFHCGVSVLVFLIIQRLLTGHNSSVSSVYLSPPFIAAMLFAVHPIHTEAVTWISGLPDVSFPFFYLLSFYLYVSFRDGAKRGYILSVLSFSAAAFSKEPALTLPIMLIAYDYLLKNSDETFLKAIKRYIPYVVVSGSYLLMRYYALGSFAPTEFHTNLGPYESIINVFPLFKEYLTSLLWPLNLNLWHSFHPISSLFEAMGIMSVAVTVIFFVVAIAAYRKNKIVFFSFLLFVVPLLPAFYIKGIGGKPFAERYLYLTSVGYVLLSAVFLSWATEKLPQAVRGMTIVFTVIAGLYTVGTVDRNNVWKNDYTLWSDTVRKAPDEAWPHYNLGTAYAKRTRLDEAANEFIAALKLDPDFADAHNNLGYAYANQNRLDEAVNEYITALRLRPDYADAHYNLGNAYLNQNRCDEAVNEYITALRLRPDYVTARFNLEICYERMKTMKR
ncbi:MAG: tetratricopeptide repeat protein [Thermodesulfovibrionales bacterium]